MCTRLRKKQNLFSEFGSRLSLYFVNTSNYIPHYLSELVSNVLMCYIANIQISGWALQIYKFLFSGCRYIVPERFSGHL